MRIKADALERLAAAIFRAEGCSAAEAASIGTHLVSSNLAGHDSHGVIRVPRYVTHLREGRVVKGQALAAGLGESQIARLAG